MEDCQKAYNEYQSSVKQEKESLLTLINEAKSKAISTTATALPSNHEAVLNEKKALLESCQTKAAQFVQIAKVFI